MKKLYIIIVFVFSLSAGIFAQTTPYQVVEGMGRGINLGNVLSAPTEGNWAPAVFETYFTDVKDAGFTNVRIPVDFYGDRTTGSTASFSITSGTFSNYTGSISDFTVNPGYLDRLKTVVDWSYSRGLYTVIDFHGANLKSEFVYTFDSVKTAYTHPNSAKRAADLMKFKSIWTAIANKFITYDEKLIFEVINEPYFHMSAAEMDALNTLIISTIRATGGNNVTRSIIITGGTLRSHEAPTAIGTTDSGYLTDEYLIASFHYYQPFNFTSSSTNDSPVFIWGSASEKAALISEFNVVKAWSEDHNIPITLGEFGADNANGINYETGTVGVGPAEADRIEYHRFVAEQAIIRGFSFSVWCQGTTKKTIHLRTDNPSTNNAVSGTWVTGVKDALLESGNWPTNTTITSLANGAWNTAATWVGGVVPSALNDVQIDHVVSINGDREAKNVTVSATGSLFINANTHSLHVHGDFTNEATADKVVLRGNSSQFSSIIVEGTATGAIRFRRHVNVSPLNDLISPPVRISSFASFYAENYQFIFEDPISDKVLFGPFDNINDVYENYLYTDGIALTQGKGYRAATNTNPVDENGDAIDPAQALNFDGLIETGNVNVPITVGAGSPWNLIGNPYSSYLNFKAFFDVLTDSENLGAANQLDPAFTAIYGYNALIDGSSIWTTWDANNTNYASDNITPGQGFFVKSKVGGGSVAFTPDMRIIGDTDDFISGRPSTTNLAFAKLNLTSSSNSSSTNFYFRDFNTLGIDAGYDTGAYDQSADGMFSNLVENNTGVSLVNQSLPFSSLSDLTVALVVNAVAGEPLTFSIDASTSLPANTNVYIEDLVAGTTTLLNTSNYVLTPASNLSGAGRFYLVFSAKTLNTTKEDFSNIRMYTAEKELIIAGLLLDNTRVKIFDLQGRVILSVPLETSSQLNTINMNQFSSGIYIVQLTNETKVRSQKIILK